MELPALFLKRMELLTGGSFAAQYEAPQARGLRINTLKASADGLRHCLPLSAEPVPFCRDGYAVPETFRAGSDPLHHAGAYYMQEPSAMSAVTLLAPQPGERVLDLCAAPGGKSTQIAAALSGTGLLWCHEFVRARAAVLLQNLERCGVRNAVVTQGETAPLCHALAGYFDAVLADLPCSGEGMFRKEPAALEGWSVENIRLCAARGAAVLDAAAEAVRPGGRLLVSTCTFAPEENECQIAAFLARHPEFALRPLLPPFGRPAYAWEAVFPFADGAFPEPDADLSGCRRIFPADGGEGHFLALLEKRDGEACTVRPYVPPASAAAAEVQKWLGQLLDPLPEAVPVRFGERWYILPPLLPKLSRLHVLRAGVPAAEVAKNRLEPTHALYMAYGAQARSRLRLTLSDPRTAAFLRGEPVETHTQGYTAVCVEDIPTGFGKASGGMLKNHYPKGLRLNR